MTNVNGKHVEEKLFNDTIFKNSDASLESTITTDAEFTAPMVQTWYYTNDQTLSAWVESDGIPMAVIYNSQMFNTSKDDLGVYIIKRYHIREDNKHMLSSVRRFFSEGVLPIEKESLKMIDEKLGSIMDNYTVYQEDIIIRIVYFVPSEEVLSDEVISNKLFTVSNNINSMLAYLSGKKMSKRDLKGLHLFFQYYSKNEKSKDIFIAGRKHTIHAETAPTFGEDHFRLITTDSTGYIHKTEMLYDLTLAKYNILDTEGQDRIRHHADVQIAALNLRSNKIKAINDWRKYLTDSETSIHKMLYAITNNEIAKTKLEKEELATVQDSLKFIKDLVF